MRYLLDSAEMSISGAEAATEYTPNWALVREVLIRAWALIDELLIKRIYFARASLRITK